ncbi:MAG: UDP-N-acetylmuramate--L-alanine ligase [Ruminococcaceae bacterium]|nr:UDP-N-acetylmuramate--L-alanine ligase [Oscillospiraceae bacterium]
MSVFHSKFTKDEIMETLKNTDAKIHFIGVGGVGMYSLFLLSSRLGYTVSGSDRELSPLLNKLIDEGYDVSVGHTSENACGKDLVVYTLALPADNPELVYAEDNKIPAVSRAEYLGVLMENYCERISVSGSHGKSSTTAMISSVLTAAGLDPTVVLGASLPNSDSPLRVGGKEYLVFEGCEYKDAYLRFSPTVTVFTNLEHDHVDYFSDIESIRQSFLAAMNIPKVAIVNCDDENLRRLIPLAKSKIITYGESENADYRVIIYSLKAGYYGFKILHGGRDVLEIKLSLPGRFNAMNAAGAAVFAITAGISCDIISDSLSAFRGIERRLEKIGRYSSNSVFYDYAHHPTEIKTVIESIREMTKKEVVVIFKPHTYSRTAGFMDDFVRALSLADRVLLCEISAIREKAIEGVSSAAIASKIGEKAVVISDDSVIDALKEVENSSIVIMGAADLSRVKDLILKKGK